MKKTLERSSKNTILTGVCGGIAKYFSWDPNIVRFATIFLSIVTGWVVLLYIFLWLALPKEKYSKTIKKTKLTDFFDNTEKKVKNIFTQK